MRCGLLPEVRHYSIGMFPAVLPDFPGKVFDHCRFLVTYITEFIPAKMHPDPVMPAGLVVEVMPLDNSIKIALLLVYKEIVDGMGDLHLRWGAGTMHPCVRRLWRSVIAWPPVGLPLYKVDH